MSGWVSPALWPVSSIRTAHGFSPRSWSAGLADVVERLGVTIYEQTPRDEHQPGRAETPFGVIRHRRCSRATEGFTARLPGLAAGGSR